MFVYKFLTGFYNLTFKLVDRGLIEFFGPLSIVRVVNKLSVLFSFFQTGFLYNYIFIMLIGIIVFFKLILSNFLVDFSYYLNSELLICFLSLMFFISLYDGKNKKL